MRDPAELEFFTDIAPQPLDVPSSEEIGTFERRFGVALPADYLRLITHVNGGWPKLSAVRPIGKSESGDIWEIDHFLSFHELQSNDDTYYIPQSDPPLLFPFAKTGMGDFFLLDFRTDPPSIKATEHDFGDTLVEFAPTFGAFIDALFYLPNPYLDTSDEGS